MYPSPAASCSCRRHHMRIRLIGPEVVVQRIARRRRQQFCPACVGWIHRPESTFRCSRTIRTQQRVRREVDHAVRAQVFAPSESMRHSVLVRIVSVPSDVVARRETIVPTNTCIPPSSGSESRRPDSPPTSRRVRAESRSRSSRRTQSPHKDPDGAALGATRFGSDPKRLQRNPLMPQLR